MVMGVKISSQKVLPDGIYISTFQVPMSMAETGPVGQKVPLVLSTS